MVRKLGTFLRKQALIYHSSNLEWSLWSDTTQTRGSGREFRGLQRLVSGPVGTLEVFVIVFFILNFSRSS